MSIRFIEIEVLNLRSAQVISADTRIGILHLGSKFRKTARQHQDG